MNRINVYKCKQCGDETVTEDLIEGTTPFMIQCELCDQMMYSSFYKVNQQLKATHEWYRPDQNELSTLNEAWKEYIAKGGLKLRKKQWP